MKHIPFVEFAPEERDAVLAALRAGGIAPRRVCVSRLDGADPAGEPGGCLNIVSAPGWLRAYACGSDWPARLARDLAAR